MTAAKMEADVGEAFAEAADEVEDEGTVGDGLAEVVRHPLEAAAVVGDGEISLGKPRNFASR